MSINKNGQLCHVETKGTKSGTIATKKDDSKDDNKDNLSDRMIRIQQRKYVYCKVVIICNNYNLVLQLRNTMCDVCCNFFVVR